MFPLRPALLSAASTRHWGLENQQVQNERPREAFDTPGSATQSKRVAGNVDYN
jgi:hypothetical protein